MVLQQTREEDINELQNVYKKIGVKFKLKVFLVIFRQKLKMQKLFLVDAVHRL